MSTKSEVRKHRCCRLSHKTHVTSIMSKETNVKKVVGTSGVWGLPSSNTHAVPTGFCSDCQLDNIRNKSYPYLFTKIGSILQEPQNQAEELLQILRQETESTGPSASQSIPLLERLQPLTVSLRRPEVITQ